MDKRDGVLGAYHGWVAELAKHVEQITVICLYEGEHDLPSNVRVYSLGKEKKKKSAFLYVVRFKLLAWNLRNDYDRVFVHMNQEYIFIAGPMWKLLGKPVYMWRNHYAGTWLTDVVALFCKNVFCTSRHAYVAKYQKTKFMSVGVNTERFQVSSSVKREPRSILFLARIAPSKRPDLLVEALGLLLAKGISFVASVYGSPTPADAKYYESIQARAEALGLHNRVRFHAGIPNEEAPAVFAAHDISVNCSPSGMFDKTLFEAAASGCMVLAISEDFAAITDEDLRFEATPESLAARLELLLTTTEERKEELRQHLLAAAAKHSLPTLVQELTDALQY
jgi:glycosyltransferase involved in cell wall biosynthesis